MDAHWFNHVIDSSCRISFGC